LFLFSVWLRLAASIDQSSKHAQCTSKVNLVGVMSTFIFN